jgi:hypothetical protein
MSSECNFKNYRQEIFLRKSKQYPVLPYFGMYCVPVGQLAAASTVIDWLCTFRTAGIFLTEFAYIIENNKTINPDGQVNMEYLQQLRERVRYLEEFQNNAHKLDSDAAVDQFLNHLYCMGDEKLYQLSLQIQPQSHDKLRRRMTITSFTPPNFTSNTK